jgi:hypothetical protein
VIDFRGRIIHGFDPGPRARDRRDRRHDRSRARCD